MKFKKGFYFLIIYCLTNLSMVLHDQNNSAVLKSGWQFRQEKTLNWNAAKVLEEVHTDLLNNKLIPDPFTVEIAPSDKSVSILAKFFLNLVGLF